jgi:hypothetical protein
MGLWGAGLCSQQAQPSSGSRFRVRERDPAALLEYLGVAQRGDHETG